MINSFNNFYNNLSSDSIFFFWIILFLLIFLVVVAIILIKKNKKLIKLLKEEQVKETPKDIVPTSDINQAPETKVELEVPKPKEEPKVSISKQEDIVISDIQDKQVKPVIKEKEEPKENNLYQKNVLREISSKQPTSPIHIEAKDEYIKRESLDNFTFNDYNSDNGLGMTYEDPNVSPLEEMEDIYEVNDNMKFASEIVDKMEKEVKPSNIELTDYEKKQEEEAIISYDELLKVKDKIYNITDDEETDEFIDELKSFRIDLR